MKLRRKLGGAALLLLLGCGSSPFTVNGSIHGNSLKPGDAISAHGVLLMGGDPIQSLHRPRHGRRPNGEGDQRCRSAESRAGNAVISAPGSVLALDGRQALSNRLAPL